MTILILGLVVFLGAHSVRIFAEDWRGRMIARLGEGAWKGLYSAASRGRIHPHHMGLCHRAAKHPLVLWVSPEWLKHLAIALNLVAVILFAAYLVPAGRMKARLGHPMLLSIKVWAFAHLLANGTLADVLLFGGFLVWAIADFAASRRRDRALGVVRVAGPARNDAIAVVVGALIWVAILWRVHQWVIGVSPLALDTLRRFPETTSYVRDRPSPHHRRRYRRTQERRARSSRSPPITRTPPASSTAIATSSWSAIRSAW